MSRYYYFNFFTYKALHLSYLDIEGKQEESRTAKDFIEIIAEG